MSGGRLNSLDALLIRSLRRIASLRQGFDAERVFVTEVEAKTICRMLLEPGESNQAEAVIDSLVNHKYFVRRNDCIYMLQKTLPANDDIRVQKVVPFPERILKLIAEHGLQALPEGYRPSRDHGEIADFLASCLFALERFRAMRQGGYHLPLALYEGLLGRKWITPEERDRAQTTLRDGLIEVRTFRHGVFILVTAAGHAHVTEFEGRNRYTSEQMAQLIERFVDVSAIERLGTSSGARTAPVPKHEKVLIVPLPIRDDAPDPKPPPPVIVEQPKPPPTIVVSAPPARLPTAKELSSRLEQTLASPANRLRQRLRLALRQRP